MCDESIPDIDELPEWMEKELAPADERKAFIRESQPLPLVIECGRCGHTWKPSAKFMKTGQWPRMCAGCRSHYYREPRVAKLLRPRDYLREKMSEADAKERKRIAGLEADKRHRFRKRAAELGLDASMRMIREMIREERDAVEAEKAAPQPVTTTHPLLPPPPGYGS